jgi:anthranilate synthase component 2
MRLLMIDNYDSFTYNIVQYFGELGAEVEVFRNDEITLEEIAARRPDRLVVSPGPCSPAEAGISVAAIRHFMGQLADPGRVPGAPEHWRCALAAPSSVRRS